MKVPQIMGKKAGAGPPGQDVAPGTAVGQVPPARQAMAQDGTVQDGTVQGSTVQGGAAAQPQTGGAAQPQQTGTQAGGQAVPPPHHKVHRTRVGGVWVASALFALILVVLLIFILENSQQVKLSFFGANGHLPLGVAMLLAAALGVLLVAVPGTARIIQLRRTAKRHRKQDVKHAQATQAAPVDPGVAPPAGSVAPGAQPGQAPAATAPPATGSPAGQA